LPSLKLASTLRIRSRHMPTWKSTSAAGQPTGAFSFDSTR
jgi:hypothetical protein